MKFFVLCLTLCAALAFADVSELGALHSAGEIPPAASDDIVFAQTYVYANITNGIRLTAYPCYWADDFVLAANADIQNIRFWIVYNGGTAPTTYDLAFSLDNGDSDPSTATTVWSQSAVPATLVDTGDDQWGLDIYEVTCAVVAPFPSLLSGERYWLECLFQSDIITNDFILMQNLVYPSAFYLSTDAVSWTRIDDYGQPESDVFFELYNTPVALQRNTWGTIKSIF